MKKKLGRNTARGRIQRLVRCLVDVIETIGEETPARQAAAEGRFCGRFWARIWPDVPLNSVRNRRNDGTAEELIRLLRRGAKRLWRIAAPLGCWSAICMLQPTTETWKYIGLAAATYYSLSGLSFFERVGAYSSNENKLSHRWRERALLRS